MLKIPGKSHIFLAWLFLSASFPTYALDGNFYLGTSLGAGCATVGTHSPQIIYDNNLLTDSYPLNNTHTSQQVFSVNGGYEFKCLSRNFWVPTIDIGLGIYTNPSDITYKGQLIETASGDPASLLFNYNYRLQSTRVMAETQLTWRFGCLLPFVNLGLGPAWNRLNDYTETAVNDTGFPPLPAFQAHTNVNLSYQFGIGISTFFNFQCNPCAPQTDKVSIGYRYVYLGNNSFGTRGADYPYILHIGTLKTNEIYLSYTHLF